MMVYDISSTQLDAYCGKPVIVRTGNPGALLPMFQGEDLEQLVCICIEDLTCDVRPLARWKFSGPIDLILEHPDADFPNLYRFSPLVESHPIRACIAVTPGFGKAVHVAAALHFAVKLEVGQPDDALIEELLDVLNVYLHSPGVTEPVEFFHSLLLSYCHKESVTLWAVQEEDPTQLRHVTDAGVETLPGRLAACDTNRPDLAVQAECRDCPYREPCAGYFKWPDPDYGCAGIKRVFTNIKEAAETLTADLDKFDNAQKGPTS